MSQLAFLIRAQFIASLIDLPKFVHSQLLKSLHLFARDRQHPSLHVEPLKGSADGLFSVRIDQDYRVIFAEQQPDHIQMIAVAKHDEAYRLAERLGGGLQVQLHETGVTPRSTDSAAFLGLVSPTGRKYLPLAKHLTAQPASVKRLDLDFAQIILIISDELPKSAYLYQAWWANDITKVQAAAWIAVGWKTVDLQLAKRKVAFVRAG
ncbi:MAG: type II toxin-antitoxin system RelE family toxin [Candidatus Acidiferrales bacterium]